MTDDIRIRIPESGLAGLEALIDLGPEGVTRLHEAAKGLPLTLSMKDLTRRLAADLDLDPHFVFDLVVGALMPLNHLRVSLGLETAGFLETLSKALEQEPPADWRTKNLDRWRALTERIGPLFEKDNIFSLCNKSYQMLVNRPNPVADLKILSELRPVYSEDAASVRALVQAQTLVVGYMEGDVKRTIFLSMDLDDLRTLAAEVDRAKLKKETVSEAASDWGVVFLTQGRQG